MSGKYSRVNPVTHVLQSVIVVHINLHKLVHASFIKINFTPYLLEWNLSLCEDDLTDSNSSLSHALCVRAHVHFVSRKNLISVCSGLRFHCLVGVIQ